MPTSDSKPAVINSAETKVPAVTIRAVFQNLIPRMKAMIPPVMFPLPGKGVATKMNIPQAPYFWNFSKCFSRVFVKSLSMKLSIGLETLLKKVETGPSRYRMIKAGTKSPATAKKSILCSGR